MLEKNQVRKETEEEKIDKLLAKKFDKHYDSKEVFEKELVKKLNSALRKIEEGEYLTTEQIVAEMEEKYNIKI